MGIIDIGTKRFVEFDNNQWALTNKGIDCQTNNTIINQHTNL